MGLSRFELLTSRLSGVRSNQLSYRPKSAGFDRKRKPLDAPREIAVAFGFAVNQNRQRAEPGGYQRPDDFQKGSPVAVRARNREAIDRYFKTRQALLYVERISLKGERMRASGNELPNAS